MFFLATVTLSTIVDDVGAGTLSSTLPAVILDRPQAVKHLYQSLRMNAYTLSWPE